MTSRCLTNELDWFAVVIELKVDGTLYTALDVGVSKQDDTSRTWGRSIPWPPVILLTMNREPVSVIIPFCNVPFTRYRNSAARGCVCGVFIPQGPRKPARSATPAITS